jgi:cell pole-organizing protein PopZ
MGDMSREPSMEDILSSIRRVIARDEAPGTVRVARAAEADDILDLHDEESDAADPAPATDELVSEASADAARQSLEALTAAIGPAVAAVAVATPAAAGRTMEDVVLDALRPMLKEWLDTNLPPLVEAMVAKEISRITGRRL